MKITPQNTTATAILSGIILLTIKRFQRPELTETQLFLEYWYIWPIALGVVLVSGLIDYLVEKKQDEKDNT